MFVEVRVQLLRCDRAGCILGEYANAMNGAWVFILGCVYRCHVLGGVCRVVDLWSCGMCFG